MPNTTGNTGRDPYGAGKEHNPSINGQEIKAVKNDPDTRGITHFQLADGSVLDYQQAIQAVDSGNAQGLIVQNSQYGRMIRTSPDGDSGNNLDSFPEFK